MGNPAVTFAKMPTFIAISFNQGYNYYTNVKTFVLFWHEHAHSTMSAHRSYIGDLEYLFSGLSVDLMAHVQFVWLSASGKA